MSMMRMIFTAVILLLFSAQSFAATGEAIYREKCAWCHGDDGYGNGPAAKFLVPAPRDFTSGIYKWKTTPFDEYAPTDDDFYRMIKGDAGHDGIQGWDGMNGTSMPGWGDTHADKEIKELIAYLKTLSGFEKPEKGQISFVGEIKPSKESIEKGRLLFEDACSECHGKSGRGNASKKLKDDWGVRTWPRDLTKPWTFRGGSSPKDIYARVTIGIPGTQMPSFADPVSKKKLSEDERWHLANFVSSLFEDNEKPKGSPLKILSRDEIPGIDSKVWDEAEGASFYLFPQLIAGEKLFNSPVDSVTARAIYNGKELAFLIEWDDPTQSIPGNEKAMEIADGEVFPDKAAIQLSKDISKIPYLGTGQGSSPVEIWQWDNAGEQVLVNAKGFDKNAVNEKFSAEARYHEGRWRVLMKKEFNEGGILPGEFQPIAFAVWDGSNGEAGSKHTLTAWHWFTIEKKQGYKRFMMPGFIALIVAAAELLLVKSLKKD